ncbi:hypothetical protein Q7P35_007424 [Cladosporium inversicolor]
MGTYRPPPPTKQPTWNSIKADLQAYRKLQGYLDQIVNTTPHDCEVCGLNNGGFDLIMHIHFGHNLDYSDVCPCDDCVVVQLNKSIEEERQQREAFEVIGRFFYRSGHDETVQTAASPEVDTGDSPVFLSKSPVSGSQLMNSTPVAQHQNPSVAPSVNGPQQHYTTVKTSPSLASLKHAVQTALAPTGCAPVIRTDSMSLAPNLSSPFTSAQTSHTKIVPAVANNTQHTRVDSAVSTQSLPAPSAVPILVPKPSQPAMSKPKPTTTKPKLATLKLNMVPDKITFFQFNKELSEKNLPYQVSKIECGEMYEENGKISWAETRVDAPQWLDGNDNIVKSIATGKNMRWCPCLPHNIRTDVPAWQITCWYREAAAQGYSLRQQDFIDRGLKLSASGLTGRVQKWQSGVGMLSQARSTFFKWPSKQAMGTVAGLNYHQARFNTWWDCGFSQSHGVWFAIQPSAKPGYRDMDSIMSKDDKSQQPYYFVQNHETRKVSEYVKLVDDATLFLSIEAEECGMTGSYAELLSWFSKPAEDQWTRDLEADLVVEFGRWREGCRDTPSVAVLRTALQHAGSVAEVEAIKRADYRMTPWLQDVVAGLAPLKESRRSKDAQKKHEVAQKVANRGSGKRKIAEVDGVEMGAGQDKKRAG